jgi:imidazolonepropionase-like amidohydrolase
MKRCDVLLAFMTLAFGATAQAQTAAAPPTSAVLIENVRIFDGTGSTLSAPSNVLVVGNKINQISTARIVADPAHQLTTVKGGGRTLMPGMSDMHVHLFMSASSQAELMDPKATFASLEAKATAEAERMLLRGFTAARDVGGPVFGIKRAIDQGKTVGPRLYPSGAMISQTSGHGDFRMPSDRSWASASSPMAAMKC